MLNYEDFEIFCNGLQSGFLKRWKGLAIHSTLNRMPVIVEDSERLGEYLINCLEMEGFSQADINKIKQYITEKFN